MKTKLTRVVFVFRKNGQKTSILLPFAMAGLSADYGPYASGLDNFATSRGNAWTCGRITKRIGCQRACPEAFAEAVAALLAVLTK